MDIGNFKNKLTKLNPALYVHQDLGRTEGGLRHSAIYYKQPGRTPIKVSKADLQEAHSSQIHYLEALEAGEIDKYMCGVCLDFVPEYDIINTEYVKIIAMGWRSTLLRLVSLKVCTLEKARKVFNCASLGESDYDRANFHGKIAMIKKLDREQECPR